MDRVEQVIKDRKYQFLRNEDGLEILVGPPEGLVDSLGLPEPTATRLHNILYDRGYFNSASIARDPRGIFGALQEALAVDAQKLTEAFFKYEEDHHE